jgi:hypothetical protein
MDKLIRDIDWDEAKKEFRNGEPFHHLAIDNFFRDDIAEKISNEFPDFDDATLGQYDNTFGLKKVKNHWDDFPKYTYQAFTFLGILYL